jgi:hypothetical protein
MMWGWFNGGYGGFWGMWFMPIIMIAVWGLIIWGIVAFVRGTNRGGCWVPLNKPQIRRWKFSRSVMPGARSAEKNSKKEKGICSRS